MSFSQGAQVLSFREQIKEIFMLYCGNVCAHLQQMFPGLSGSRALGWDSGSCTRPCGCHVFEQDFDLYKWGAV